MSTRTRSLVVAYHLQACLSSHLLLNMYLMWHRVRVGVNSHSQYACRMLPVSYIYYSIKQPSSHALTSITVYSIIDWWHVQTFPIVVANSSWSTGSNCWPHIEIKFHNVTAHMCLGSDAIVMALYSTNDSIQTISLQQYTWTDRNASILDNHT